MFRRFVKKKEASKLEEPISRVLERLNTYDPSDPEYQALIDHMERLNRLKELEGSKYRVTPDTMAIVAGNVLVVLVIVAYEQKHVLVSRALAFVRKTS